MPSHGPWYSLLRSQVYKLNSLRVCLSSHFNTFSHISVSFRYSISQTLFSMPRVCVCVCVCACVCVCLYMAWGVCWLCYLITLVCFYIPSWVHVIFRLRHFALSCVVSYVWFDPASWAPLVAQLVEHLPRMQNVTVQVLPEAAHFLWVGLCYLVLLCESRYKRLWGTRLDYPRSSSALLTAYVLWRAYNSILVAIP